MKKYFFYALTAIMTMGSAMMLSSCELNDEEEAELLTTGYWQGYLGAYYQNHWNLTGTTYATEMYFGHNSHYSTSGRGYEVDYDTRSPFNDYAYCTFRWFIVDGEITLIYDDNIWSPVYIMRGYHLSPSHFSGYINDGSGRNIYFDFENIGSSRWGGYSNGSNGVFNDYNYYYSRTRAESTDDVPFIDRSEKCTNTDGYHAVSILSGSFAVKSQQ